jgi:transposase
MAPAPTLSDAQWRKIENDLPAKRRDRQVISAVLYRASSGQSLRDVATAYGITRARLSEWETLLEAESVLPKLMQKLGLDAAGSLAWRGGGQAWQRRHNCAADVTALRLEKFGQALRRTR